MQGFHNLIVWQEAATLAANVILVAPKVRGQSAAAAADQMVRAAESISANIAEGYGRGLTRDCLRFLKMARSSTTELESHLRVALMARRLSADIVDPLIDQTRRVGYLIKRYMDSVERRGNL